MAHKIISIGKNRDGLPGHARMGWCHHKVGKTPWNRYSLLPFDERIRARLAASAMECEHFSPDNNGKFHRAIKNAETTVKMARGTEFEPDAHYYLGRVIMMGPIDPRALYALETALSKGCKHDDLPIFLGKAYLRNKENEKAESCLAAYIHSSETPNQLAYFYLGMAKFHLKKLQAAVDNFDRAEKIGRSASGDLHFRRGWAKARLGLLEGALADFEKAAKIKPNIAMLQFQYGKLLHRLSGLEHVKANGGFDWALRKRRLDLACGALALAKELGYSGTELYEELSGISKSLERPLEAENCLRKAIELENGGKRTAFLYHQLSDVLLQQEKPEAALEAHAVSVRLGLAPEMEAEMSAKIKLSMGRQDEAGEELLSAIKKGIDSGPIRFVLAHILNKDGMYFDALVQLRNAEQFGYVNRRAHLEKGIALLHTGQPDLALLEFEKAEEAGVDMAHMHIEYARACNTRGKYADAVMHLKKAEEISGAKKKELPGRYYYELGYSLSRLKGTDGADSRALALKMFDESRINGYNAFYCHLEKCGVYFDCGMLAEADAELRKAVALGVPEKDGPRVRDFEAGLRRMLRGQ